MRNLIAQIRNLIMLARVTRPGLTPQVSGLGDRPYPDMPHMQGPGVFFVAPAGARGVIISPSGDPSVGVVLGMDGTRPDAPAAGEGGLHYIGEWKVFVAADGSVHLGEKDPSDFVALASKVDQLFQDLATAINGWTPAAGDGGAALKTALTAWLTAASASAVGSTTVKCA